MADIFDDVEFLGETNEITSVNKWNVSDEVKNKINNKIKLTGKLVGLENSYAVENLKKVPDDLYDNAYLNMRDSIDKIRRVSLAVNASDDKAYYLEMIKSLVSIDGGSAAIKYINDLLGSNIISEIDIIRSRLSSNFNDTSAILDEETIKSLENIIKLNPETLEEQIIVIIDKLKTISKYYVFNKEWNMDMVEEFINKQLINICIAYRKNKVLELPQELESEFELAVSSLNLSDEQMKKLDDLVDEFGSSNDFVNKVSTFTFDSARKKD